MAKLILIVYNYKIKSKQYNKFLRNKTEHLQHFIVSISIVAARDSWQGAFLRVSWVP